VTQEVATSVETPLPVRPQGRTRLVLPQLRRSAEKPRWHTVLLADLARAFEARRLLVLLPFAMIGGLIVYAGLPQEPMQGAVLGVVLLFALVAAVSSARPLLQRAAVLALAIGVGLALMPTHGLLWGTQMLVRPAYGTFEAVVDEILSETEDQRRIVVSQLTPAEGTRSVDIRRARLVAPGEPALAPGDRIRANLRLARVPGPILPGAFDSQFHAYFAGIGAYGNVTSGFEVVARDESFNPTRSVDGTRRAIGQRVDAVLEGPSAAIAWAMLVGDQSNIDDATRDAMANSGLAHIYSISGLHLSIVAGGVFFIVRALVAALAGFTGSLPAKKIAAVVGIAAAIGYLLLAGGIANTPAFRSTLMLVLIFGAVLANRRALTMRNVALAALVILLIDPADVFRASFQLSFAAVVALIGVYELPRQPREGRQGLFGRSLSAVWVTAWTSLVAGLATLLFAAYHFQQTAPLGVLANVMTLPVLSFVIMPFGVFSVLAMPFGIEQPFVEVLGWGIDRMMDIAVLVAGWSTGLETNPLLRPPR
jgi:competence protein ComEC